jgi:hypothetical protein
MVQEQAVAGHQVVRLVAREGDALADQDQDASVVNQERGQEKNEDPFSAGEQAELRFEPGQKALAFGGTPVKNLCQDKDREDNEQDEEDEPCLKVVPGQIVSQKQRRQRKEKEREEGKDVLRPKPGALLFRGSLSGRAAAHGHGGEDEKKEDPGGDE